MADWRTVLLLSDQNPSADEIEAQYRALARKRHPDMGGSHTLMLELNAAKIEALKAIKEKAEQHESPQWAAFRAAQSQMDAQSQYSAAAQQQNAMGLGNMLGMLGGQYGQGLSVGMDNALKAKRSWLKEFFSK